MLATREHWGKATTFVVLGFSAMLGAGLCACGGAPGAPPGGSGGHDNLGGGAGGSPTGTDIGASFPPGSESNPRVDCSRSAEMVLAGVHGEETVPSWSQIDCYTAALERRPLPTTLKRYTLDRVAFGMGRNEGAELVKYFEELSTMPGANASGVDLGQLPPHFDRAANQPYSYPIGPMQLDYKLRVAALVIAAHKAKGRVIELVHYWGQAQSTTIIDLASYKHFIETDWTDEKIAEAKAAERMRVELYSPLPVELETIPRSLPFLAQLSAADQVALCQFILDKTREAVRPYFHGTLVALSHNGWSVADPAFKSIDFSQWDQIDFTFFPGCEQPIDVYMTQQLAGYLDVVERSQVKRWGAGEIDIWGDQFSSQVNGLGCMTASQFFDGEPGLWQSTLDAIKGARLTPVSIVPASAATNPATLGVIEQSLSAIP